MIVHNEADLVTLAKTLEGEARGESVAGKMAVAWVVRNRASRARFAGGLAGREGAVASVCTAPWQFSCWNASDPNRKYLAEVEPAAYGAERLIAERVLADRVPDPTDGADHYHTTAAPPGADQWPPVWAALMRPCGIVGAHAFYEEVDPAMKLSANFWLAELTVTMHRNLDNRPPYVAVENLRQLCRQVLEPARAALGNKPIYINSGYRSREVNAAVGGQPSSQHMTGQAADFICPAFGTPQEICRALRAAGDPRVSYDQLIWEDYNSDWVHISWSPSPRRMAFRLPGGASIG